RHQEPARQRRRDSRFALRRLQLRPAGQGPAGVLGAIPPGSLAGPARQPLPFPALRRDDGSPAGVMQGFIRPALAAVGRLMSTIPTATGGPIMTRPNASHTRGL